MSRWSRVLVSPRLRWAVLLTACSTLFAHLALALPHLAIAPVTADAPEQAALANTLTERLGKALREQGQFRVSPVDDPHSSGATASQVRRWALETGAEGVVAGRLEQGVLWIELRSAHSGGLLGGWTLAPDADEASLAPLMAQLREALGAPPVGAAGEVVKETSRAKPKTLVGSVRSDGPISIHSDELDVVSRGGKRHLVFRNNVLVEQGDIELRSEQLDAYYNEGESQPERLVAVGGVHVIQGDRVARCDRATYLRAEQLVVCSGHATLVQGCDVVRGGRIEFDLEREHFTVMGAASVVLGREDEECDAEGQS